MSMDSENVTLKVPHPDSENVTAKYHPFSGRLSGDNIVGHEAQKNIDLKAKALKIGLGYITRV
mgnify:CR=1 FL=1